MLDFEENIVHLKTPDAGSFKLKHANVRWFLSVNYDYIPDDVKATGQTTLLLMETKLSFQRSYEEILFGLDDSIRTVSTIRNTDAIGLKGEYHPFCKKIK